MLYRNAVLKIKKHIGRYLSLLIIILVGTGFYAGIDAAAPDISDAANDYYREHSLMDFRVSSPSGLTDSDAAALSEADGVTDTEGVFSAEMQDGGETVRILSLTERINTPQLVSGRMPKTDAECAADSRNYKIGDIIRPDSNQANSPITLKAKKLTVVGLVNSVLYLTDDAPQFIYVSPTQIASPPAYTEIYIRCNFNKEDAYTDEYNHQSALMQDKLESDFPDIYFENRSAALGYGELDSSISVITAVASVLPLLFILVALLMAANSMARMIAEERGEIGTLASLGYSSKAVISAYLLYVLSASIIGTSVGYFVGCRFIPPLVYSNFRFILPPLSIGYNILAFALICLTASLLMAGITIVVCCRELKNPPASLLRPLPPKRGKRILLERVGFIWKHLSFTWKITLRNMFRYKKRGLMTILGVAGCASLLLVAFGLRDSMDGVAERQYGEIFRYNTIITLGAGADASSSSIKQTLADEGISEYLAAHQEMLKCKQKDRTAAALETVLVVPQDKTLFADYYRLHDKKRGERIELPDSGKEAIVTGRLAKVLKLKAGSSLTITDKDGKQHTLTAVGIAENYAGNYIYMGSEAYKNAFGKSAAYNTAVADYEGDEDDLVSGLAAAGIPSAVTFTDDAAQKMDESTDSLTGVIVLIAFVAALLAIVVLYNLTSINISERTREIAALKTLGFRDDETGAYIYREALILTLISIVIGMILGHFLHSCVLGIIETGALSLIERIRWQSYLISAGLTLFFSIIMQVVTYFKLRTVDMAESLKSVE